MSKIAKKINTKNFFFLKMLTVTFLIIIQIHLIQKLEDCINLINKKNLIAELRLTGMEIGLE